jgi:hypothetical protein
MLNDIYILPRFDIILNGDPIGLGNHASQQHGNNIGESSGLLLIEIIYNRE